MNNSKAVLQLNFNQTYSVLITDRSISLDSAPSTELKPAPLDPPGLELGSLYDPAGPGGDFSPLLEQSA